MNAPQRILQLLCICSISVFSTYSNSAAADCGNNLDDDGDGWIDELDDDCQSSGVGSEASATSTSECNNTSDDDGVGGANSMDPDCFSAGQDSEHHWLEQSECPTSNAPNVVAFAALSAQKSHRMTNSGTAATWSITSDGSVAGTDLECFSTLVDRDTVLLQEAELHNPSSTTLWHVQYDLVQRNRILFDGHDQNGDGSVDQFDIGRHADEALLPYSADFHWAKGTSSWIFSSTAQLSTKPAAPMQDTAMHPSYWLFGPGSWATRDVSDATGCEIEVDYAAYFDPAQTSERLDPPYAVMLRYAKRHVQEQRSRDQPYHNRWSEVEHLDVLGATCDPVIGVCVLSTAPIEPHPISTFGIEPNCFDWSQSLYEETGGQMQLYVAPHVDNRGQRNAVSRTSGEVVSLPSWGINMNGWSAELANTIPLFGSIAAPHDARLNHLVNSFRWNFIDSIAYLDDGRDAWAMTPLPDGIQLDMSKWKPGHPDKVGDYTTPIDTDNDNTSDWGYSHGCQGYGLGMIEFLDKLESGLSSVCLDCSAVVYVDSSTPWQQSRFVTGVAGAEMEGFPMSFSIYHTNQMSGVSNALYHLMQFGVYGTDVGGSYAQTKNRTDSFEGSFSSSIDPVYGDQVFRLGLAASLIAGEQHAHSEGKQMFGLFDWDEYRAGEEYEWGWLGAGATVASASRDPDLGVPIVLDPSTSDVLFQFNSEFDTNGNLLLDPAEDTLAPVGIWNRCSAPWHEPSTSAPFYSFSKSASGASLDVHVPCMGVREKAAGSATPRGIAPEVSDYGIRFYLPDSIENSGTAAVSVRIQISATVGSPVWSSVYSVRPRLIEVRLEDSMTEGPVFTVNETLSQYMWVPADGSVESVWVTFAVAFDRLDSIGSVVVASGEEMGSIQIDDIRLYQGTADRWYSGYPGGLVFMNGGPDVWTTDFDSGLYPAGTTFQYLNGYQSRTFEGGTANMGGAITPDSSGKIKIDVPAFDAVFVRALP